jgi:hypothetical protein
MIKLVVSGIFVAFTSLVLLPGPAQARSNFMSDQHERYCSDQRKPLNIDKVTKEMALTDVQKVAFKDYEDTRLKAEADMRATICASKPDFSTFRGRLEAQQLFLEAHLAALKSQIPKLITFYDSLDPKQKAMFDETRVPRRRHHRK